MRLPHAHGIVPHFVQPDARTPFGSDLLSTVDTAWLLAGGLWAARFLRDRTLEGLAERLYHAWTGATGPLRTCRARADCCRTAGAAMGVSSVASGTDSTAKPSFCTCWPPAPRKARALEPAAWQALQPFYGVAAGRRFNNADLGLFVFQYGLDLLDLPRWRPPGDVDLMAEAAVATEANRRVCGELRTTFRTYRRFWGLSAGDGPGEPARPWPTAATALPAPSMARRTSRPPWPRPPIEPAAALENVQEALYDRTCARGAATA